MKQHHLRKGPSHWSQPCQIHLLLFVQVCVNERVTNTHSRYKTNCGTSAATSCSRTLYRRAIFTGTNVRGKPRWVDLRTASIRRHTHGAIFSSRYAIYARWLIASGRSRSENSVMSASWHGNLAEEDESRTEAGRAVATIKQQSLGHGPDREQESHSGRDYNLAQSWRPCYVYSVILICTTVRPTGNARLRQIRQLTCGGNVLASHGVTLWSVRLTTVD